MFKMTLMYHPFSKLRAGSEAKPKDLENKEEILRFAQNDNSAVSFGFWSFVFVSDFEIRYSNFYRSGIQKWQEKC